MFPKSVEHQNNLRNSLKAQIPWAPLISAELEFLEMGPRAYAFLKGSWLILSNPVSPN